MAQYEYTTIIMPTNPGRLGRRWVMTSSEPKNPGKQVGEVEEARFINRLWQGLRLLESAVKEMDAEGWELVSHSFHDWFIGGFWGTAVLRRPASKIGEDNA